MAQSLRPSSQPLALSDADEAARMAAVRRYDVLDTPPDGAFDRITALAARIFDVPISIVSIVDTDRIWFKSHYGMPAEAIDRAPGLCASAILSAHPWVLENARLDPRSLANPLVAQQNGIGFYAGIPLTTYDGYNLGTLCVLDLEPRPVTDEEVATLRDLAAVVMDELELRRDARRTAELQEQLRSQAEAVARSLQRDLLPPVVPQTPGLRLAARYHVANQEQVGGDFYDVIAQDDGCAIVVGDACGKGVRAAALTGTARWALRMVVVGDWTPAQALDRLNEVLAGAQEHPDRYCTVAMADLRQRPHGVQATVALGGHPHPLIVRTDGTVERFGRTSPIVGWTRYASFEQSSAMLAPGDLLLVFTDGLLEVTGGHASSDDTALQALLRPLAGCSPEQVADRLDRLLGAGTLADDAAFVVAQAAAEADQ